ncbi:MAG: hypothetical protein A4E64_02171 [Syntrophorhabdus sp. PtaU1.Bin058]|nr:MAG: hypothetical protein A4E64_02171 [Syntrophorhabdus sp. PtaU1.Bin058]
MQKRYLSERFEKSPTITETFSVADHLRISYADRDVPALPLIRESFLRAYAYVKDWFDCRDDIAVDLWVAPTQADLEYMTCMRCEETFFCAPGIRDGMNVILFVSPLRCRMNADPDRLAGILAHEITHHVVRDISRATVFSMKRKEKRDVPMWLEEGLCQFIDSEVYPPLRQIRAGKIAGITKWYDREELWDDLSSCDDADRAYLQAYKEVRTFVETNGKEEIIRLLYLNRTHCMNWNDLPGFDTFT